MFKLIVAISNNNCIGKDNSLLWHLPNDLKFFKEITTNKTVVMGRKTFESIGKELPNRKNIILSKVGLTIDDLFYMDFENDVFIIGGGEIYKEFLGRNLISEIYITHVDVDINGDTYFPEIYYQNWKKEIIFEQEKDDKHIYNFKIIKYSK